MVGQLSRSNERVAEKERATAQIQSVIDLIAQQKREPDLWERVNLSHAINSVFRGAYNLATATAEHAMTPIHERSPFANLHTDELIVKCDLTLLQRALKLAEQDEVREFPSFGPIVLK